MLNSTRAQADKAPARRLPSVCCVLVNWNGWQDTADCLHSLRAQTYPDLHIVVVDNGSTDGSAERVQATFPEAELIYAGANLGFPRGLNVGLRRVLAGKHDLVWVLNNDTVSPPETLQRLVETALVSPQAGLVGSVLHYAHDPAQVQAWGGGAAVPWLGYTRHFTAPHVFARNDYLTFASVLIRREVFETIGLLYEGSFMYYEDTDFCLRALAAGWSITVAADTAVLHKEGASMPGPERPAVARFITAAGLRFIRRHARWGPLTMPLYVALRFGNRLLRGRLRPAFAVLQGVADYRRSPAKFLASPAREQPATADSHLNHHN